jgi:hypothetical protein
MAEVPKPDTAETDKQEEQATEGIYQIIMHLYHIVTAGEGVLEGCFKNNPKFFQKI